MRDDKVCSTIASAESEARRSPAQHFGRIVRECGWPSSGSDPGRFSARLQKMSVAGESGAACRSSAAAIVPVSLLKHARGKPELPDRA